MKKAFFAFTNWIPFIMVGLTALSAGMWVFDFYSSQVYRILSHTMGYSLLTNLVFLRLFWRRHYCNPTKASVLGLIAMNLFGLLWPKPEYYVWFDIIVAIIVLFILFL